MGQLREIGKDSSGVVQYQMDYAPPFAGLDSSAPPAYIRSNALLTANNAILVDSTYTSQTVEQVSSGPANVTATIGIGDLEGVIFTVDLQGTTLIIYSWPTNPLVTTSTPVTMGTFTVDTGVVPGPLSYININGVCFFSWAGADSIYQHNNTTASLLTNYLGAAYLAELNGRLLAANVIQNISSVITPFPYQVAWSAPGGAYNQFNPLVGGLVTGAGFNNLPDVEDIITGIFTTGPTGYVVRRQGITEMSPLNSGIQPFDFSHLWASHKGIGTVYPQTIAQYGSLGAFVADDDIYTIGYEGINVISGFAKTAIYAKIASNVLSARPPVFQACLCPLLINSNPELYYIILVGNVTPGSFGIVAGTLFMYCFTSKEWTTLEFSFQIRNLSSANCYLASVTGDGYEAYQTPSLALIVSYQLTGGNPSAILFSTVANTGWLDDNLGMSLIFPTEEVLFGREITVDGALLYMAGTIGTTVKVNISGFNAQDGSVSVISLGLEGGGNITISASGFQYYKLFPVLGRPITVVFPQLSISATAVNPFAEELNIGKVSYFLSFDPMQRVI